MNGYYDILGGKTAMEAAIRKFKEETNMEICNLCYVGNLILESLKIIFDNKYNVTTQVTLKHIARRINRRKLI